MPTNFLKLTIKPGLSRDTTNYANEGGWYDCDKVRFRSGSPEKIGGWDMYTSTTYQGTCSHLHNWIDNGGNNYVALFTNLKAYIEQGGAFYDITPIRKTTSPDLTNNPFSTTISTKTVNVKDVGHGALIGDFVTISGATGPVGGIPAAELNAEFQIASVTDVDNYVITMPTTTASATTTGGGNAVVLAYQIHVGLSFSAGGNGWGASYWGRSTWGSGINSTVSYSNLRVWSADNYGEDLIFCDRGGSLYQWVAANGPFVRAVYVSNEVGASDVPTIVNGVLVTEQRQVVVWGCNPIGSPDVDPLFIRWSASESTVNWTPTPTNDAGGYKLSSGSTIVTGKKAKTEVLFWTNSDFYTMQYLGGDLVYGFQFLEHNISIMGPHSVTITNNKVFWMGMDKFYSYTGKVDTPICPLRQQVFQNFNMTQGGQCTGGTNEGFNELIWFYPTADSNTNNVYVIYNYREDIWYYGTMARSAWLDSPLKDGPVAATNNYLVMHEMGINDENGNGFTSYIESSDFDLTDGFQFSFIKRLLPDVDFSRSTALPASVIMTLQARDAPGASTFGQTSANTVQTTALIVDQYTGEIPIRLRGRQAAFRIESTDAGVQWQLGYPRIEIQADGRR